MYTVTNSTCPICGTRIHFSAIDALGTTTPGAYTISPPTTPTTDEVVKEALERLRAFEDNLLARACRTCVGCRYEGRMPNGTCRDDVRADLATLEAAIKQLTRERDEARSELRVVNLNEQRVVIECDEAHRKVRTMEAALKQRDAVVEAVRRASRAVRYKTTRDMRLECVIPEEVWRGVVRAVSALDALGKEEA